MKPIKKILTYTWLAKKCIALWRSDPGEFLKLTTSGSEKIIRGAKIQWSLQESDRFAVWVGGRVYCYIHGNKIEDKWYTTYDFRWGPTQYRKRFTDKYLPITLPEGVRSRCNDNGRYTKCLIHDLDGTVAREIAWRGGMRGHRGRPVDKTASADYQTIAICDTTGKALCVQSEYLEGGIGKTDFSGATAIGFFPGASRTRREWVESIRTIPGIATDHVLSLAAKTYLAANRLCQKYPRLRMAAFPAIQQPDYEGINTKIHGYDRQYTVIDRDFNGKPVVWGLPVVSLYWMDEKDRDFTYLDLTIPPHGSRLMSPEGYSSYGSRVFRDPTLQHHRKQDARYWERAYHSIPAYKPSVPADKRIPVFMSQLEIEYMADGGGRYWDLDSRMMNWGKPGAAGFIQAIASGADSPDVPFESGIPVAIRPDELPLMLEEKFLVDSLPLC